MFTRAAFLVIGLLLVACDDANHQSPSDVTRTTDATSGGEADAVVEPEVFAPPDMGNQCLAGCEGELCYSNLTNCRALCLVDRRDDTDVAYCSMPCADGNRCPGGFACLPVEEGGLDVMICAALPAVCGNDRREVGEACDDGNTDDDDFCSADCSRETVPSTRGRVTVTIAGDEPYTIEGEVEGGFARLYDGVLRWNGNGVELELLSIDESSAVGVDETAQISVYQDGCEFGVIGFATLTALDLAEDHISGHIDNLLTYCNGQCFGCGGGPRISIDFDMVWLEWPTSTSD